MQIFTSINDIRIEENTAVALGNFDGLHIGHAEILKQAIKDAKNNGLKSLCYTFSNHPFNFIMGRNESEPEALKLICSEDEKISMLEDYGFDYLVNVPFDEITMKMSAADFFNDVLVDKLNAKAISVGFNYSYGARAQGNAKTLAEECKASNISLSVHDAVMMGDKVVSSTLIREEVAKGNMELVADMLDRPYSFSGDAVHGKSVGSDNGVPTINLEINVNRAVPLYGVYAATTVVDDTPYRSIVNIGNQPTFGNNGLKLETHLFDYNDDAYGKTIVVKLEKFIRPEREFDTKEELYAQIKKDCEAVL